MTETIDATSPDGPLRARAAFERCITGGGIAAFPADGLYGLACDPLSASAIARIHELKGREERKPSAVMYFALGPMRELISSLDEPTHVALAAILPGAVTAVVANPEQRYPLACREDPERLGVRLIGGALAGAGCPVFQTSANRSGEPAPSRIEEIGARILAGVDLAIDGGGLSGIPSTVVELTGLASGRGWSILREGAMPLSELEARLGSPPNVADSPL